MMQTAKTKVLVVDDHAIVRMGLIELLKKERDIVVVGDAENGEEAVALVEKHHPDVVLMDFMMPQMDGAEATAAIHGRHPETKIVILTTYGTSEGIGKALRSGASGAVQKNIPYPELLDAIRKTARGECVISPDIQAVLDEDSPIPELTERQKDILHSVTRGLTNNEIAKQYGITYDGVKSHLNKIFRKLGASGKTEAITIALRKHLLKM